MEKYTKCIEFASSTVPQDYSNFVDRNNFLLNNVRIKLACPFQCIKWTELCGAFLNSHSLTFTSTYPYLKSCEYTEKVVKENTELFDLKLQELVTENQELKSLVFNSLDQINDMREHQKLFLKELEEDQSDRFLYIEKENQELKSLVYNSLDQINELKEHNKSLSSRIFELESLLEKKEVPNLIDL